MAGDLSIIANSDKSVLLNSQGRCVVKYNLQNYIAESSEAILITSGADRFSNKYSIDVKSSENKTKALFSMAYGNTSVAKSEIKLIAGEQDSLTHAKITLQSGNTQGLASNCTIDSDEIYLNGNVESIKLPYCDGNGANKLNKIGAIQFILLELSWQGQAFCDAIEDSVGKPIKLSERIGLLPLTPIYIDGVEYTNCTGICYPIQFNSFDVDSITTGADVNISVHAQRGVLSMHRSTTIVPLSKIHLVNTMIPLVNTTSYVPVLALCIDNGD